LAAKPEPPIAAQQPVESSHHGERRLDAYAWLRAANWREAMQDPSQLPAPIRAYLAAENAYADQVMADTAELRKQLYRELRGRLREDDATVPLPHGPWTYYLRYREGGQHPLVCRAPRDAADDTGEEVLFDGDARAQDAAYFRIVAAEHSPDHRLLACALDLTGAEACSLRVLDLTTGAWLATAIEQAQGDVAWAADGRHLFYTVIDAEHRPRWVRCRDVHAGHDTLVYEETDPGFFVGVDITESGRFVLIACRDPDTSEVHAVPADAPTRPPRCLLARQPGVEYAASDHGDRWIIHTNAGDAADFRIVAAPLASPQPAHWSELVPHRPGVLIEDVLVFADHLVRLERTDALPRIVIRAWATGDEHTIAFDEPAYALELTRGYEFATTRLRLTYSSPTTPDQIYDYAMDTGERTLRKAQTIPSGHDPAHFVAERIEVGADDGASVPVSLLRHRDVSPGPTTPLMLSAYGAYGIPMDAGFSPHRLSLVNRGVIVALAHVRGGRDKGDDWYRQGKITAKPNTFGDCIAAAESLVERGYTAPGYMALHGGSAGGMLVGAVINQRPELFRAAVADVPFVDVLNTMLDPELPLTPPEWPEWGNPIEDAEAYRAIRSYSPYDNVAAQAYPHLLVTAGVSDPRVTYWEPAKWVARLRALKTDANWLLLRTNMSAGHGGAAGRFDFLEEIAFRYAFLLKVIGRTETAPLAGA
jgi:oligopeptidase B